MAAEAGVGALANREDGDGRENSDDPVSRAGRSASEPSMAEIDMLLPGLCDWLGGASRERKEFGGAFADCDREP